MTAWLGVRFRCLVVLVVLGLVCLLSDTGTWFVVRLDCTLRTEGMLTAEAIGAAIKGTAPVVRQDEQVGNDFLTQLASSRLKQALVLQISVSSQMFGENSTTKVPHMTTCASTTCVWHIINY